jgi:hypothetical protein
VPSGRGGTDAFENLALACRACNVRKAAGVTAVDPLSGDQVPLFNPRQHVWAEHFQLYLPNAHIEGQTAIGRATVRQLGMNRRQAARARRRWLMRLIDRL